MQTDRGELKVIETVVIEDEPAPLPAAVPPTCRQTRTVRHYTTSHVPTQNITSMSSDHLVNFTADHQNN